MKQSRSPFIVGNNSNSFDSKSGSGYKEKAAKSSKANLVAATGKGSKKQQWLARSSNNLKHEPAPSAFLPFFSLDSLFVYYRTLFFRFANNKQKLTSFNYKLQNYFFFLFKFNFSLKTMRDKTRLDNDKTKLNFFTIFFLLQKQRLLWQHSSNFDLNFYLFHRKFFQPFHPILFQNSILNSYFKTCTYIIQKGIGILS